MDERMQSHLKFLEREFPRDPQKRVDPPPLSEEDENLLDQSWQQVGQSSTHQEPPPDSASTKEAA